MEIKIEQSGEVRMKQEDKLLNLQELAEYLNVTKRTVYRLLDGSDLPSFRVGSHLRFKREEIDEWLDQHRENRGQKSA